VPFSSSRNTGLDINEFIESSPIAIVHIDDSGHILEYNQSFAKLIHEQFPSDTAHNLLHYLSEEDRPRLQQIITDTAAGHQVEPDNFTIQLPDALIISVFAYTSLIRTPSGGAVIVMHLIDQTEQKNLEERFSHSQKMQAVGQLAGGVAHDFNNLLTAMIGFCDLLLMRHPAGDPSFADIMQIKQNANRAANLVRQLLAFSRRQTLQPKMLNITDVLAELSHLINRLIGDNITMDINHGRALGMVRADQGQLEQVIINLAVNARDAMPNGGELRISSSQRTIEPGFQLPKDMHAPAADEMIVPGDYVVVEVTDTGTGIPIDIIRNIFEPFFSTKEVGSGTGLGLATCYGIIKQTGGYIYVRSTPGKGTTFCLFFKAFASQEPKEKPDSLQEAHAADLSGKATIMLVEDETPVRIFAARALRNKGYEVLEADSGETALDVFAGHDGPIDMIISDVVMPGMNGPKMIVTLEEKFPERMPDIPVVFISGYAEDAFIDSFGPERSFNFLPKPFTLKQLAGKVKEVLED
jgi:two-component system cell cycle sensor histidine kinase/response regulator CckA